LLKIVDNSHREWHTRIPHALWVYRTNIRNPIEINPFSLIYGTKAILPLEIEILSLWIALQVYITDEVAQKI